MVIVVAVALIGLGVVLSDGDGGGNATSASPEALELSEEGVADLHSFRWQSAIDKLDRALELDPTLAEASIARIRALANLGRNKETEREVARADSLTALLQDDDRRLVAAFRLSRSHESRYASYRDSLTARMEREKPRNIYLLVAKARMAYDDLEDYELQQRRWQDVIDVDPNYTDSYNMLGYGALKNGDYELAIEHMQKYAFLAPDLANPHDSLGEVYMAIGRYEDAEAEYIQAVKMQPNFYYSLVALGKIHLLRGQMVKGQQILEGVRAKVTDTNLALRVDQDVINMYLFAGNAEELNRLTAAYVTNHPKSQMSCFYRGIRLAHAKEFQAGQAVMDSCIAGWRGSEYYAASLRYRKGIDGMARLYDAMVADVAGETGTAVRVWRNVLEQIADTPMHDQIFQRYRCAAALHTAGQPAEALAVLEPVMAVNARFFNVLDLAIRCYVETGQATTASQVLKKFEWCAERSDPDYPARERVPELRALVDELAVRS